MPIPKRRPGDPPLLTDQDARDEFFAIAGALRGILGEAWESMPERALLGVRQVLERAQRDGNAWNDQHARREARRRDEERRKAEREKAKAEAQG